MLMLACQHCSAAFADNPDRRGPKRKFCSQKCAVASWHAGRPDYHQKRYVRRPRKKRECQPVEKVCKDCGAGYTGVYNTVRCAPCKAIKTQPRPRRFSACVLCQKPISAKAHPNIKFCGKCSKTRRKAYWLAQKLRDDNNEQARMLTRYAVKIGFLPDPKTLKCVSCKRVQAECYDHRDYSKPLHVDPVCCRCNSKRGRGVAVHFPCVEYVTQTEPEERRSA